MYLLVNKFIKRQ